MSTGRKDGIICLILLVLFFGLLYGEYHYVFMMEEKKVAARDLRTETMILERQAQMQMRQIEVFKRGIAELEGYRMDIPEDEVDFYSWVQRELTKNGIRSNVVKPVAVQPGRNGVQIDFEGPYYSFVRTLADWRNMKVAVRLTSVALHSVEDGNAKGVAVLESVLKSR